MSCSSRSVLDVGREALDDLIRHAESGYPEEVCGFLIGVVVGEATRVTRIRPVRNVWSEDEVLVRDLTDSLSDSDSDRAMEFAAAAATTRFAIDPREQLQVMREVRGESARIVGLYHSHPDHPAVPSGWDAEFAWEECSFAIASVVGGCFAELRSWRRESGGTAMLEETILTTTP